MEIIIRLCQKTTPWLFDYDILPHWMIINGKTITFIPFFLHLIASWACQDNAGDSSSKHHLRNSSDFVQHTSQNIIITQTIDSCWHTKIWLVELSLLLLLILYFNTVLENLAHFNSNWLEDRFFKHISLFLVFPRRISHAVIWQDHRFSHDEFSLFLVKTLSFEQPKRHSMCYTRPWLDQAYSVSLPVWLQFSPLDAAAWHRNDKKKFPLKKTPKVDNRRHPLQNNFESVIFSVFFWLKLSV